MNNKCVYCSWEENEDYPDYHKPLMWQAIPMKINLEINTPQGEQNILMFETSNDPHEAPYHDVDINGAKALMTSSFITFAGDEYYLTKKINYCPMCGKRLSKTGACNAENTSTTSKG